MPELIELLESLNRKERFFLVKQALGNFQLSDDFRRELGRATDLDIPSGAFAAMDYHLDWLAAALCAHESGDIGITFDNPQQHDNTQKRLVRGNQEDTDLLIAFKSDEQYHIVLVEAKGATNWNNEQMKSKADRLKQIFGHEGTRYREVIPHFCLVSPSCPEKLRKSEWPGWMTKDRRVILLA